VASGLLANVTLAEPVAFAIAIGQDGNAAVVKYVSLENPTSPRNVDGPVDLTGKGDAVVTVTDGDGDVATSNTDIGDQLIFEDDGPVAAINDDIGGSVTIDDGSGSINISDVEKDLIIKEDGSGGLSVSNVRGAVDQGT